MRKFLTLGGLILAFALGACAHNDGENQPPASGAGAGPAGSEVALPSPRQAGVIGR